MRRVSGATIRRRRPVARGTRRDVSAYVDEPGVDAGRETETLAEIVCEVRTARWAGVPFTLRSGKALGENRAEIVVTFAPVRHLPPGLSGTPRDGGTLRFGLGPETMSLELNVNSGEDGLFALERETLRIEPGDEELYAYTEVLGEILERDVTLSVRADSAERCWRIVEPVRRAWDRDEVPLEEYRAGSAGPEGWASSRV